MPAAVSISVSASAKGRPSRVASRRPIDDLPAPIMPTSTSDRVPKARDDIGLQGRFRGIFRVLLNGSINHASFPARRNGSIYQQFRQMRLPAAFAGG